MKNFSESHPIIRLFVLLCFISFFSVNGQAQVFKPDKELGRCGANIEVKIFDEDNLEHARIQRECENFDDKKEKCLAQKACKWQAQQKYCEPNKDDETDQHAEFCTSIMNKEECLRNKLRCDWGYKKPACNAISQEDVDFCEEFDSDEFKCKKHPERCDWD